MSPARAQISDAERDVLKALWEVGPATVRELRAHLHDHGRQWAHTTINTLLGRMVEKGLVVRDKSDFAHVFSADVTRDQLVQQHLEDLAEDYCGGRAAPLMVALVEQQGFSADEIEQFRQLIDRLAGARLESGVQHRRDGRRSSRR